MTITKRVCALGATTSAAFALAACGGGGEEPGPAPAESLAELETCLERAEWHAEISDFVTPDEPSGTVGALDVSNIDVYGGVGQLVYEYDSAATASESLTNEFDDAIGKFSIPGKAVDPTPKDLTAHSALTEATRACVE